MKFIQKDKLMQLEVGETLQYKCAPHLHPMKSKRHTAVTVEKLTKDQDGSLVRIMLSTSHYNILASVEDYEKCWVLFK